MYVSLYFKCRKNGGHILLKAIIFDMDGVLLDSESVHYHVIRDMLKQRGFHYKENHFLRFCGTPEEQMWPILMKDADLTGETQEKLQEEHWKNYNQVIASQGLPGFPGVNDFLELLKKVNIRIAVASSSLRSRIEENLRALQMEQYFDCIVSAQECGVGKPEPDVFLLAAKKLQIAASDCMVIEDSVNGMIAAYRAGMKWIGFCGAEVKPDMSHAVFTFADYRTAMPKQFQQWYDEFPERDILCNLIEKK